MKQSPFCMLSFFSQAGTEVTSTNLAAVGEPNFLFLLDIDIRRTSDTMLVILIYLDCAQDAHTWLCLAISEEASFLHPIFTLME